MAVRHGYGKIEGTDALVFAYDTGDTRNSYKGEPTTNYTTDSGILQNGWSGGFSLLDSSTKSFQLNVSNFHTDNRGWRSFMWDMRAHAGSAVTISATIEVPADSPGDFAWVMVGQANTRDSGTTTATYLGYSSASERTQKSTSNTERISWSGTVGNTGTANQPNGIIGFTVWYNGGTIGTNSFIKVSNVQIELKDHATPFVNGTRSVTEGLKDFTKNSTLDLTNVSFDSNAQIEFDGTDDEILVTPQVKYSTGSAWTAELVFEPTTTGSWNGLFGGDLGEGGYWMFHGSQQVTYYEGSSVESGTRITYRPWEISDTFTLNEYHHLTIAYTPTSPGSGSFALYYNGGEKVDTFNYGFYWKNSLDMKKIGAGHSSRYGTNNIKTFKFYNRALTTSEIKANYNAIKGRFNI